MNLEHADGACLADRHHAVADVAALRSPSMCPTDELFEALDARRRRRNESSGFRSAQVREERGGILDRQLPQDALWESDNRQVIAPVARRHRPKERQGSLFVWVIAKILVEGIGPHIHDFFFPFSKRVTKCR